MMSELKLPPNPTHPPIVGASVGWHVAMLAAGVAQPAWWPVWLGGVVANHLGLCAASMWPRSTLLGPNIRQLPPDACSARQVCITIDDGPDPEMTPRVLQLLADADAHASFFCIGDKVNQYPALVEQIMAQGHSVENHTQTHHHRFAFRGRSGLHSEIASAQKSISEVTGQPPRFFRAPAGMRNPFLQPVLATLGLRLTSWTRRGFDTVERSPNKVFARLTRELVAGDILLIHDGHGAQTLQGSPVVLEILPRLLAEVSARELRPVTLPHAFAT